MQAGVHNRKFRIDADPPPLVLPISLPLSSTPLPATQWLSNSSLVAPLKPDQLRSSLKSAPSTIGGLSHGVIYEEEEEYSDSEAGSTPRGQQRSTDGLSPAVNASQRWTKNPSRFLAEQQRGLVTTGLDPVRGQSGASVFRTETFNQQQNMHISVAQPRLGQQLYTPFFRGNEGGLAAAVVEGPGVFYLGIIDILQEWSWSKRIERWIKSTILCQDKHGISVMPPQQYAERFQVRVISQLVDSSAASGGGLGTGSLGRAASGGGVQEPEKQSNDMRTRYDGALTSQPVMRASRMSTIPIAGRR